VIEATGLYLDYSKNRITDDNIRLLLQLAEEPGKRSRIDAMFAALFEHAMGRNTHMLQL
jgi:glucose-6-phosphate isomerase